MTASYAAEEMRLLRAVRDFVLADRRMRQRVSTAIGLNLTDLQALRHVIDAEREGDLATPLRLADHLGISTASTSGVLDRLTRSGHITRGPHPDDRRSIVVLPTESAHRDVRARLGDMHERMRDIASDVPAEARDAVVTFLERLTAEMDAQERPVVRTEGA